MVQELSCHGQTIRKIVELYFGPRTVSIKNMLSAFIFLYGFQGEVRRLQEANRSLQQHAELLSNQVLSLRGAESSLDMPEIARREALISQLIAQSKFISQLIYFNKTFLPFNISFDSYFL